MAKFDIKTEFNSDFPKIVRAMEGSLKDAMTDVILDLKRVASEATPHKSGYLSQSASHNISMGKQLVGTVGFSAFNKKFNYAEFTHNETYNLGEKSKRKQGGKSAFGSGVVPVGKGYLSNALAMSEQEYLEYLNKAYQEALG